ncbi:hypothetical protein NPIL_660321 [Nephila pilipes]|uniref:Uncharacterized protein n=1 Tax=Nephila pilipes TaxID=299642 RepID=A0A8X6N774_NEPPI|nr:hypothetical protein NPIL_660321 [Nephila pilipes]
MMRSFVNTVTGDPVTDCFQQNAKEIYRICKKHDGFLLSCFVRDKSYLKTLEYLIEEKKKSELDILCIWLYASYIAEFYPKTSEKVIGMLQKYFNSSRFYGWCSQKHIYCFTELIKRIDGITPL